MQVAHRDNSILHRNYGSNQDQDTRVFVSHPKEMSCGEQTTWAFKGLMRVDLHFQESVV